jgi:hypothetical protein
MSCVKQKRDFCESFRDDKLDLYVPAVNLKNEGKRVVVTEFGLAHWIA